jgi:ABC-type antimicrobial peptide transport system permease subunit
MSRRTAELEIRMALGAQRGEVMWMVLRRSLVVSLIDIALGFPLVMAGGHFVQSMLFGVKPGDAWVFGAAALRILLAAIVSGALPARRAASIDPLAALRSERRPGRHAAGGHRSLSWQQCPIFTSTSHP